MTIHYEHQPDNPRPHALMDDDLCYTRTRTLDELLSAIEAAEQDARDLIDNATARANDADSDLRTAREALADLAKVRRNI